jgi:hypothetical protein
MEERGQYITLICLQHQKGHLSPKTICLSLGLRSVNDIPDVISKFQTDKQGLFYNERLDSEIEKRLKYSDSRRSNGIKGGRPRSSNNDAHDKHMDSTCKACENHSENVNVNINDNEIISKEIGGAGGKRFKKPTVEEVNAYCLERQNNIDPEYFVDYYESTGWVIGKSQKPMKDWKSTIRQWEQQDKNSRAKPQSQAAVFADLARRIERGEQI